MGKKTIIWYDEEGNYLEILSKKCKDTYFNEIKKDFAEIIDKKTNEIIGCAIFNFKKNKERYTEVKIELPKELLA